MQLALYGPSDASSDDAQDAIEERLETGENPDGWEIKIVDWRGKPERKRVSQSEAWNAFSGILRQADLSLHQNRKN